MSHYQNAGDMAVFDEMESEVRTYCRAFPTVFQKARGHLLIDESGREYIDFFAGAGTLNYGHNSPPLKEKLLKYLSEDNIIHSLDMATTAKRAFMERLRDVILKPRRLDYKIQFTGPTGTNAVEAALKLARLATGRQAVIAFSNAYHGMSLGALAATNNPNARAGAGVVLRDVVVAPYEGFPDGRHDSLMHLRVLLESGRSRQELPAAAILETVQAEGGINVASSEWLQGLAGLLHEYGVLLILDDIQVGCGRTGKFFSFEESGIQPDIVCLSKSLSGLGLPLSCVLMRRELDVWKPGQHTGTFRGHNPAFVTATAALSFWEGDGLSGQVERKGEFVKERLGAIAERHQGSGLTVRGRGLIWGLVGTAGDFGTKVAREAFRRGLVIETAGRYDEVLKLLPPLTIEDEGLDAGLRIIEDAVEAIMAG